MHDSEISRALRKLNLDARLGVSAPESVLASFEARLNVAIPEQVAFFYRRHNGLEVAAPALTISPLEQLTPDAAGRVRFCTMDGVHPKKRRPVWGPETYP